METQWIRIVDTNGQPRWRLIQVQEESRLDGIPKALARIVGGIDKLSEDSYLAYLPGGQTCPFYSYSCAVLWIEIECKTIPVG
ncbi:hypothetical protein [Siphonobacter sp. BAB-5385]|uniref:hypothetical protein n=1 Tax=Siphonobacter sp. BAB-5385 TaxID=1864822 RepID=UPI001595640D|nr:hypothetical protein [Siphonobacter sp. BAB-5385]